MAPGTEGYSAQVTVALTLRNLDLEKEYIFLAKKTESAGGTLRWECSWLISGKHVWLQHSDTEDTHLKVDSR